MREEDALRLPVIDLGASADDVVRDLRQACAEIGFFQVVGHGVDAEVIEATLTATDRFFALPMADKQRCAPSRPEVDRGYAALGTEGLTYSLGPDDGPPDLFEAFNVGPEWAAGDPVREQERLPNHLHGGVPRLDCSFFAALTETDHSTDTLRCNHYPQHQRPQPRQLRMGAHTDYGILTVLYADRVAGLQIVGPDGAWHDVLPEPGSLIVNLPAQWTNDLWRSTLHRVVPPPGPEGPSEGPTVRRWFMAFVHDGNYDPLVECLPTCQPPKDPPRYPPVLAGDHLIAKLVGPRTLSPSEATSTAGDRLEAARATTSGSC